ncbi:MAG: hypothetical protein AAF092_04535 [Pseudomonadota bacterium]
MLFRNRLAALLMAVLTLAACGGPDLGPTRFHANGAATRAVTQVPELQFPARIGVVRIVYGRLTVAPAEEQKLFLGKAPPMGEFVAIGPLETRLAGMRSLNVRSDTFKSFAASRNLDYLLVIELAPGRNTGEALFLDAATGHPFASFEVAAPGRGIRNFWGSAVRPGPRRDRATLKIAEHMVPGMTQMLSGLAAQAR